MFSGLGLAEHKLPVGEYCICVPLQPSEQYLYLVMIE